MNDRETQPAVVVGVDGSMAAVHAALWAVDEAVSRDIPLRLVHIVETEDSESDDIARALTGAKESISRVVKAVEATDKPVKVETEIIWGPAAATLVRVSRQAAMVCVGAVGSNHFQHGRIGSTAAALAGSAHCAVAIIRGAKSAAYPSSKVVLVATDNSPNVAALLEIATGEAVMRDASLRVVTCWQPPRADPAATVEGDREIRARLDRAMAGWRGRYPGLRVELVAAHGGLPEYLATHASELQLLIVSARGPGHVREVVGSAGNAALSGSDCVVLVVDHHHL